MTVAERETLAYKLNEEVAKFLKKSIIEIKVDTNWRAQSRHGQYNCNTHELKVSRHLVHDADVENTILHELCHAYAPYGEGHGPNWKELARRVGDHFGTKITRCSEKEHDGDYKIRRMTNPIARTICAKCDEKSYMYKRCKCYRDRAIGWTCAICGGKLKFETL